MLNENFVHIRLFIFVKLILNISQYLKTPSYIARQYSIKNYLN